VVAPVADGVPNPQPQGGAGRVNSKGYTVLGWVVFQVATRVAKRKIFQNRVKLGAAGALLAVLVGGVIAAKSRGED
jgi:hypothetical protein